MLLLEQERDVAVRRPQDWNERKYPVLTCCDFLRYWLLAIRRRAVRLNPETRLAHMVMMLRCNRRSGLGDESALLERLEAEIAATEDVEVRKVLATYLSEP